MACISTVPSGMVEIYAISIYKGVIKNGYHGTCCVDGRRLDACCGGAGILHAGGLRNG